MKTYILLLTILTTNLFAVDSSIYTWGYGEIFYKVLLGVTILSTDNYLFSSAVAVGGLLLTIKNMNNNGSGSDMAMMMGKYLLLVTLIIGFFVETKKTYIVEDEVTGQTFPVNNVPIGIGETFSLFTLLEKIYQKHLKQHLQLQILSHTAKLDLALRCQLHLILDNHILLIHIQIVISMNTLIIV